MKIIIATALFCSLLTGCSSRYDSGHDQLFQLSDRHVIYRDLTVPASMGNLPEKQEITSPGIEP
ncbi:hypothetical protein ABSP78_004865 [Salmonella enterica subsp. enterica serovar 1,4,[5],12:i:-]|uniref:Lipoprotein n=1 Tax=Salmonella enterica TaxID=28901 RepID=A0A5U2GD30_SALER|nr:hypothetical protein [Salmonella enterica]EGI0920664.1 hypothetical protein [Salmonella enterica]EGK8384838.1 hypothetical protein [Salmonella enterica]EJP9297524.1 hypothetical protein [Salmonella enterica]